ncbi:MAG: hypothetical protein ACE5DX_00320 [Candidatus Dojkabacteria bacterium]
MATAPVADQADIKDQNVLSFMMQLVQEKHGEDTDIEFLNQESNRLYDTFGDQLVSYFEPMLTDDQRGQFDQMVDGGSDQDSLLNFLVESIPDLESQIMNVLMDFRSKYLGIVAPQEG